MRLSEAIRLGAMLHPQYFDQLAGFDQQQRIVATCALGAAAQAGYDIHGDDLLAETVCPIPRCLIVAYQRWPLCHLITHLNNDHRWTREQIADWVSTLEPPLPEKEKDEEKTFARDEPLSIEAEVGISRGATTE